MSKAKVEPAEKKRKPRPVVPSAKKPAPAPVEEVEDVGEEDEDAEEEDAEEDEDAEEEDAEEDEDAEEEDAEEAEEEAPAASRINCQSPVVMRAVMASNPLARRLAEMEPNRTNLEVFIHLDDAADLLNEDPVDVESAMRLLSGMGVCNFVLGRRDKSSRIVWLVGNLRAVLDGKTEEYSAPIRSTSAASGRALKATAKITVSSKQRALLCKELGVETLDRDALRAWAEDLLKSAVEMFEE